jgi:hypothetical protein
MGIGEAGIADEPGRGRDSVQPEAPSTEAGRRLLEDLQKLWPYEVPERILAIEAEAYRQGWDANTATSFGNRAASQERPQPDVLADVREQLERFAAIIEGRGEAQLVTPHGMTSNGPRRALGRLDGVAQERPPIDVLREVEDVIMSEPWWPRAGAIRRRAVMEKIRARLSRSVASPEPSE